MRAFICSEELWARGHGSQHPLKPERLKRTWELLQAYGAFDDVDRHIDELEDRLVRWTEIARRVVKEGGDKNDLGAELERVDSDEMTASGVSTDAAERYKRLCPVKESSVGLYRYCSLEGQGS